MARFSPDDIVKDLITDRFGRVIRHRGKTTSSRNTFEVRIGPRPIDPVVIRWNSQLRRADSEECRAFEEAEKKALLPVQRKSRLDVILEATVAGMKD